MPTEVLPHRFTIATSPDAVLAHLADPHSYVGLTPFVVAVRDVGTGPDGAVTYTAVERFRMAGVLRWDNPIRVVMRVDRAAGRLVSDVTSPGRVRLRSVVEVVADGYGTVVDETVTVSMPAPLRRYVCRQARAAALYRADTLVRRLSRPS